MHTPTETRVLASVDAFQLRSHLYVRWTTRREKIWTKTIYIYRTRVNKSHNGTNGFTLRNLLTFLRRFCNEVKFKVEQMSPYIETNSILIKFLSRLEYFYRMIIFKKKSRKHRYYVDRVTKNRGNRFIL